MLTELYQLSKTIKPLPVGYITQKVDVLINVDLGTATLLQTEKTKKDKTIFTQGKKMIVPNINRNGTVPVLIVDVGEYVLGLIKAKHEAYMELLYRCYQRTRDNDVKKIIGFLDKSDPKKIIDYLKEIGCKSVAGKKIGEGLRIAFCVNGDNEKPLLITDKEKIQEFWKWEYLDRLNLDDLNDKSCIISGKVEPIIVGCFPEKIRGIPGGNSTGSAITSFDKPAYQGWGWSGNDNACLGIDTALGVINSLDTLLNSPYHHQAFGKQMFIYWGNSNGEGINEDFWSNPESIKFSGLFSGVQNGKVSPNTRPYSTEFYLGILKGNTGRVAINGISKTTPNEIANNVKRFLGIQQLIDGKVRPIYALVKAAFLDAGDYTQRIEKALVEYALLGRDLPQEYAQKLIDRICSECHSEDGLKFFSYSLATRVKGLLLYLNLKDFGDMTPDDELAYRTGRIAFLMHIAQIKGRNQGNEDTNVLRSLKALATTPFQVFDRLYQGCYCHHLQTSENTVYVQKNLDIEFKEFNPENLPEHFSLRQKSLFFIGFAKKRAEFFTKQTDNNTQEEE